MRIDRIDGIVARCSARGVSREVNLLLLEGQQVAPGDCVIVHVGFAIQKISQAEAHSAWELYDRMLAADEDAGNA
jgi:hydrogenase expression/formation protein HypC